MQLDGLSLVVHLSLLDGIAPEDFLGDLSMQHQVLLRQDHAVYDHHLLDGLFHDHIVEPALWYAYVL